MKVIVFFVASLSGGLVVGAAGRGFMMDPPVVEEEHAASEELDPGIEIVQGTAGVGEEASSDSTAGDTHAGPATEVDGQEQSAEGATVSPTGSEEGATGDDAIEAGPGTETVVVSTTPGEINPPSTQPVEQSRRGSGQPDADEKDATERLAQIFGSMDAKAAAAVLIELSDEEITEILGHLSARKAGDIIKDMPAERAGILSRVMLLGVGSGR